MASGSTLDVVEYSGRPKSFQEFLLAGNVGEAVGEEIMLYDGVETL